jgi:hypothetical protein
VRHHPYCLARPRVGPSSFLLLSPANARGMARQGAQPLFFVCPHSLSEIRGAARRATQTSLRSLGSFAASSLRRRAALFVAVRETRDALRQPSSWRAAHIGRQAEPRRRPGACLATARPQAPHPAPPRMTPHESAPRWTGRIGLYSPIGLKSRKAVKNFHRLLSEKGASVSQKQNPGGFPPGPLSLKPQLCQG